MIATKFGGISAQDAQAIDRVEATVAERPANMAAKKQVSGHEFTRAVQPKSNLGFSPCQTKPQGLKANFLEQQTARLKPRPDTCLEIENQTIVLNNTAHMAFLRASVSPWWGFSR